MIFYCYLAAGSSKRFGSDKLLYPLNNQMLWKYGYLVLKEVQKELGGTLRTVTRAKEIIDASGADALFSPDSEKGKSYSIICALNSFENVKPNDKILFLTADQPYITKETVISLLKVPLDTKSGKGPLASAVFDGKSLGNPVVFSGDLKDDLLSLKGDEGGKVVLLKYPDRIAKIPSSPHELFDIDTPFDIEKSGF